MSKALILTLLLVLIAPHPILAEESIPLPSQQLESRLEPIETGYAHMETIVPWIVLSDGTPFLAAPEPKGEVLLLLSKGQEVRGVVGRHPRMDDEWLAVRSGDRTGYVSTSRLHRVHPANAGRSGDLPIGGEVINRWWGVPLDYEPQDLVAIDSRFTSSSSRTHRLRREAAEALAEMLTAARSEGVDIRVLSSYRSGPQQLRLYESAVSRSGTSQRYSAPAGHSEHQLGTTVDLTDVGAVHYLKQSFGETAEGRWLREHAHRYGFVQSYIPELEVSTGYITEPWHWRYWGREKAKLIAEQRRLKPQP